MEEMKRNSPEIMDLALRQISELVIFTDCDLSFPDGPRMVYVNEAVERLTGYSAAELLGRSPKIFQGDLTDRATLHRVRAALEGLEPIQVEVVNYTKSGQPYWVEMSISPVLGEDGKPRYFISVQRDITRRKDAEHKLVRLENDYRFMFENVQAGVILHKASTEIVYANPMALELLGVEAASIAGTPNTHWSFVDRDGAPLPISEYPVNRAVIERTVIHGLVFGNRRERDGKMVWALCSAFPILDDSGAVTEVLTSFTDITKLIEAEDEALTFRQRFELAAAATRDVIFEWNLATREFWANDVFEEIFGYVPVLADLPARCGGSFAGEEGQKLLLAALREPIASSQERFSLDFPFILPTGASGQALIRGFVVRDDEGTALRIIGTATDVGKLAQMTSALEDAEARFRIIADMLSDVLWDYNYETGEYWVTSDWAERLGVSAAEQHEGNGWWYDYVDPADRERLARSQQEALHSGADYWETEYRMIGTDGQRIDVAVKATIHRRPNGKAYRMVGNVRDITLEKRRQEGFTRARALEAVGQLTGGVAHDFNNQLMIIQGNAEILEMSELDEDQQESVALISQASNSAAQLTRRLLSFAGQSHLSSGRTDLSALIPSTVLLLQAGIPETVAIRQDIPPDIWDVEVDPNALEQAIVNLAVNARDAMPKGGEITISCENRAVSDEAHPFASRLEPGHYVVVAVADNGEGMSKDVLSKVFEPFFTTKDVDKGTGLGLSTVYGFAKQSGGSVTISSEPGEGTTVCLYLPRYGGDDVHEGWPGTPEMEKTVESRQHRILLVEDHEQVRAHVEKLLTRMGYKVTATGTATEALGLMHWGGKFDLLFTDVVMPGGMNGQELADAIVQLDPRIKVLFTSGYPALAFEHLGLKEQENINLLRKPYRSAELRAAIVGMLGEQEVT